MPRPGLVGLGSLVASVVLEGVGRLGGGLLGPALQPGPGTWVDLFLSLMTLLSTAGEKRQIPSTAPAVVLMLNIRARVVGGPSFALTVYRM